ncbi:hypothetical protein DFS34DRAFT_252531 [Phlyctochytrium arcticum]|nr:hypothetical protein DFS34DRAFT_252531 [Phlyctochytrium arcticum]
MPRRARKVQGVPLYMYHEISLTAEEIAALSPEDHARYLEQQSVASTTRQARSTRNSNTEKAYSRWQREYIHWCEGTAAVGCMVQNDGTLGYPLETTLVGTKCKSLVSGRKLHMFLKDCVLAMGNQAKNRVGYVPGNKKQKQKNQRAAVRANAGSRSGSGVGAGVGGSGSAAVEMLVESLVEVEHSLHTRWWMIRGSLELTKRKDILNSCNMNLEQLRWSSSQSLICGACRKIKD